MIIVTRQDMVDFIKAQPDDRLVDFSEIYNGRSCPCGCIMVQYGREKGFKFNGCTVNEWINGNTVVAKLEPNIVFSTFVP